MNKTKGLLFTAGFVLAMAFTHVSVFAQQEGQLEQQPQQVSPQQEAPPPQASPPQQQEPPPPPQQQQVPPPQQQAYPPQQYQQGYPSPQQTANQEQKSDKPKGSKFYISPKYQFPIGTPAPLGGVALGFGLIWSSGVFFGIDGNYGYEEVEYPDSHDLCKHYVCIDGFEMVVGGVVGVGLSLGNTHDLPSHFKLAYGGSLGFWYSESNEYEEFSNILINSDTKSFIAPFVKLRWRFLEVSYKFFLGTTEAETIQIGNSSAAAEVKSEFGINMHELAIGFYFGGW